MKFGTVGVDGGSVSIVAAGYLAESSRVMLGFEEVNDLHSFLEFIMLAGHEDGLLHVPGGASISLTRTQWEGHSFNETTNEWEQMKAPKLPAKRPARTSRGRAGTRFQRKPPGNRVYPREAD